MRRRDFLQTTTRAFAGLALTRLRPLPGHTIVGASQTESPQVADAASRTYHVLGVPLRSGSLYPGNENDAQAYRDVKFVEKMRIAGVEIVDDGDVPIPSYLPHHSVPPIRNWPGPRIAWECVADRVAPILAQPSSAPGANVPLLIGCDCSVVAGTTLALQAATKNAPHLDDLHVLYIDGDFDDAPARADISQSAASLAVWLITKDSPFRPGTPLHPSQVTVVGWSNPSKSNQLQLGSVSLKEIRRAGPRESAQKILQSIPPSAPILVHLDIDVFQKNEMPAAYFPHDEGATLQEGHELLGVLLKDPRIRLIEISEYATLRDLDRRQINILVDLLAQSMK
jgi:arginase